MSRAQDPVEISVSGRFSVWRGDGPAPVTDPALLARLDGHRVPSEPLSAHLSHPLPQFVHAGELSFQHREGSDVLRGVTRYIAGRRLAPHELRLLVSDTRGQWSDGIGEALTVTVDGEELGVCAVLEALELKSEQRHVPGLKVPQESPIFAAIRAGEVGRVKALAAQGELGAYARSGASPLTMAITTDAVELALALLELDPKASTRRKELIHAARQGLIAVVRALLRAGVPADACEDLFGTPGSSSMTALMWAACCAVGFAGEPTALETIDALLAAGARPDQASPDDGRTALFWAAEACVVQRLLAAGADRSLSCKEGKTALQHHEGQLASARDGPSHLRDATRAAKLEQVLALLRS